MAAILYLVLTLVAIVSGQQNILSNPFDSTKVYFTDHHRTLTYYEAKKYCEDHDGHLVKVESHEEQDFLWNNLVKPSVTKWDHFIGSSTTTDSSDPTTWIDGSRIARFFFVHYRNAAKINQAPTQFPNGNCWSLRMSSDGGWMTRPCDEKNFPICENISGTRQPTTVTSSTHIKTELATLTNILRSTQNELNQCKLSTNEKSSSIDKLTNELKSVRNELNQCKVTSVEDLRYMDKVSNDLKMAQLSLSHKEEMLENERQRYSLCQSTSKSAEQTYVTKLAENDLIIRKLKQNIQKLMEKDLDEEILL